MTDQEMDKKLRELFKRLPKVVQDAITSAEIEAHLRNLAEKHKLHLDQWQLLENEVMLTLFGFQKTEDLQENIRKDLEVSNDVARTLAEDISKIVFEPIRGELERQLEHPDAKAAEVSGVEQAREQALANQPQADSASSFELRASSEAGNPAANIKTQASNTVDGGTIIPATPPAPKATEKAVRAPVSEAYHAGQASSERKSVHDDPYREPPL